MESALVSVVLEGGQGDCRVCLDSQEGLFGPKAIWVHPGYSC